MREPKGEAAAILAALLWGINYPVVKVVLKTIPESQFLLLRFSLTVLLLCAYLKATGENFAIAKRDYPRLLLLGLLGVGVYNIIWTYGIHRTTAANAALLISTSPIFAGLYAVITGEERVSPARWIGTLAAFLGVGLIVAGTPGATFSFASDAFRGNLAVLAGSLLFAFYSVIAKPLLTHYSPAKVTTFAMAGGLPVLAAYAGLTQAGAIWTEFAPSVWLLFAYVVAGGTVAAYILWYKGIKETSPVKAILFHYIVPVCSMILGRLFLGDAITAGKVAGALLVFTGLLIVKRGAKPVPAHRPALPR